MIVHLQCLAHLQRPARKKVLESRFIDDRRVGLLEVGQCAHHVLAGRADKSRIVEAEEHDLPIVAALKAGLGLPLVKTHRPGDSVHAAHAVQVVIHERRAPHRHWACSSS